MLFSLAPVLADDRGDLFFWSAPLVQLANGDQGAYQGRAMLKVLMVEWHVTCYVRVGDFYWEGLPIDADEICQP